jgi:hypothetical protein
VQISNLAPQKISGRRSQKKIPDSAFLCSLALRTRQRASCQHQNPSIKPLDCSKKCQALEGYSDILHPCTCPFQHPALPVSWAAASSSRSVAAWVLVYDPDCSVEHEKAVLQAQQPWGQGLVCPNEMQCPPHCKVKMSIEGQGKRTKRVLFALALITLTFPPHALPHCASQLLP